MKKKKILSILLLTMMLMTETAFAAETSTLSRNDVALKNINSGIGTVNDYKIAGIDGVTYINLNTVNALVKIDIKNKNKELNKEEIETVIKEIPDEVYEANKRIPNGNGTLVDYAVLNITNVTEKNIEDINWYLKGKDNSTINKIKNNISTMVSIMSLINRGAVQRSYYNRIGLDNVNSNNIKIVSTVVKAARKSASEDLTRKEIIQIVNTNINNFDGLMSRIQNGEGKKEDYLLIGIDCVTENNISDVNWYLNGKDNSTINKINENANAVVTAIDSINSGVNDWRYYNKLGVLSVNSDNIKYITKSIQDLKLEKKRNLTRQEIINESTSAVAKFGAFNTKVVNGNGTIDDYIALGLTNVTSDTVEDVNEYIKNQDNSTFSKLKNNTSTIVNILMNINEGKADWRAYNKLGINAVNSDNFKFINESVKTARDKKDSNLTKSEILKVIENIISSGKPDDKDSNESNPSDKEDVQEPNETGESEVVSKEEKVEAAKTRINNGEATISDYNLLGVKNVTTDNLEDVNWYLKGKNNSTTDKIQYNITVITLALRSVNSGTMKIVYYNTLGIDNVDSANRVAISNEIKNARKIKGKNLNRKEILEITEKGVSTVGAISNRVKSGTGSVSDYEALGITGVNSNNVSDVNDFLKNKDNSTTEKLNYNINIIVTSLKNINLGTRKSVYYNNIGLNTVTSTNIEEIKEEVKKAKVTKGADLTKTEIMNIIKNTIKTPAKEEDNKNETTNNEDSSENESTDKKVEAVGTNN